MEILVCRDFTILQDEMNLGRGFIDLSFSHWKDNCSIAGQTDNTGVLTSWAAGALQADMNGGRGSIALFSGITDTVSLWMVDQGWKDTSRLKEASSFWRIFGSNET